MPIVQNEPNSSSRTGPRRAKCAKRTQFAGGRDTPLFYYSIIPAFQPHPLVRNEANLRAPLKAREIDDAKQSQFRGVGRLDAGASCANRPNSYRCADRKIGVPGGRSCETKPIRGLQADPRERASAIVCRRTGHRPEQLLLSPCPVSKLTFFMSSSVSREKHDRLPKETE